MASISVETTQNVSLDYQTANAGDRLLEGLIDLSIIVVYFIGVMTIFGSANVFRGETSSLIGFLVLLLPAVFYSLLCEVFLNGQTFGKKVIKTRVIMLDGTPPRVANYLLRWLFKLIDVWILGTPGIVGIIIIVANGKGQRLGDIIAGTTVVKLNKTVTLQDTLLGAEETGYIPQFPQVYQLTDKQFGLIKEVLHAYENEHNYLVVKALSEKLRGILKIDTNLGHTEFLYILLKDYAHVEDKPKFSGYNFEGK
jgi:uncharacterized RDD family membrane protein YckC